DGRPAHHAIVDVQGPPELAGLRAAPPGRTIDDFAVEESPVLTHRPGEADHRGIGVGLRLRPVRQAPEDALGRLAMIDRPTRAPATERVARHDLWRRLLAHDEHDPRRARVR